MKIDIDLDKIPNLEERSYCREAIEILADAEPAIMDYAKIHSSTIRGQIEYLNQLRQSRKNDFRHFPKRHQNTGTRAIVWFSDYTGIREGSYYEEVAKWVCIHSAKWLEEKIDEMLSESIENERKAELLTNLSNVQIVLAFYYGMQALGLEPRKFETANISDFARFLHLLTGKPFKKIADSDYYDKLKIAPNVVDDQKLIHELMAVRNAFEVVGFKAPLLAIDKEISTTQKAIEEKKRAKGKK